MSLILIVVSVPWRASLPSASCATAARNRIWDLSAINGSLNAAFHGCQMCNGDRRSH